MDKRKGLIAAYKKLGPFNKFLFWLVIVGIVLTVLFFVIQQRIGATREGQETAQLDRDIKHEKETSQMSSIDAKIDLQQRPYIGVEKFSIERNDKTFTPIDTLTLYVKNYGEIPANEVNIYLDIYDELNLKMKNKTLPLRKIVPGDFVIMPGGTLKIENESLNNGVIINEKEYDDWMEFEVAERSKYFKQHNEYPRQSIAYVKLEIKYRGLEKKKELPFYLRSFYSGKYKDGQVVWSSSNSEVK